MSDPFTTALAVALGITLIIAIALGWFCYRLLVDRGRLLLRLSAEEAADAQAANRPHGLPPGAYLSDFALPILSNSGDSLEGRAVATLSGLSDRPLLIVFLRADCLFSRAFAHELAGSETNPGAPFLVSILVGESANQEAEALFTTLPGVVLLDPHRQVSWLMRVGATPCGYLVDPGRRTGGPMLTGPEALLAAARGDPSSGDAPPQAITPLPSASTNLRAPLPIGSPAPDFTLPTLDGVEWSLAAHRGSSRTLLFSDPSCPPCAVLLHDLGPRGNHDVVLISRGDPDENRQLFEATGITAPILLQRQRELARLYRILETPAVCQIDEQGNIAAGPIIGQAAVMDLLMSVGSGTMAVTPAPRALPVSSRRWRS